MQVHHNERIPSFVCRVSRDTSQRGIDGSTGKGDPSGRVHACDRARQRWHRLLALALAAPLDLLYGLAQAGERVIRPESVLDGAIGPRRRWGWSRTDLAAIKTVKNALGCTVNDVMLAAIAGGLRSFLRARGEEVDGRTVRAMVPVSMRTPQEHDRLGNEVSAVFADLPVGISDAGERLAAVTRQLTSLKGSGMAMGMDSMLTAAGLVPGALFALGARVAAQPPQRAISTVTTNVPGPQVPMYLLGRRMTELFPYIPIGAQIRITIGIASYAGQITCGVTGDFDAVPDLAVLCNGIDSATQELLALVS